jgi:hypothetical protein
MADQNDTTSSSINAELDVGITRLEDTSIEDEFNARMVRIQDIADSFGTVAMCASMDAKGNHTYCSLNFMLEMNMARKQTYKDHKHLRRNCTDMEYTREQSPSKLSITQRYKGGIVNIPNIVTAMSV